MKQKKKISFSFIHMGAPSLLMIFLVLCLFTFALLSLSSAKNNRTLSQQSADRIQAYYQASSLAEQALDQIDTILSDTYKNCGAESADVSVYQKELTEQLKNCSVDGVSDLTIDFTKKEGNIYEILETLLPLPFLEVRARNIDIDTPEDYDKVLKWYKSGCLD